MPLDRYHRDFRINRAEPQRGQSPVPPGHGTVHVGRIETRRGPRHVTRLPRNNGWQLACYYRQRRATALFAATDNSAYLCGCRGCQQGVLGTPRRCVYSVQWRYLLFAAVDCSDSESMLCPRNLSLRRYVFLLLWSSSSGLTFFDNFQRLQVYANRHHYAYTETLVRVFELAVSTWARLQPSTVDVHRFLVHLSRCPRGTFRPVS